MTNSFCYVNLDLSKEIVMFNIGLKKNLIQRLGVTNLPRKRQVGSGEQMSSQVKKVLEQRGQGLILMVRG